MIEIRLANPSDAPALTELRYALRSTNEDIEAKSPFINRCTTWISEHLQHDSWRCWVATDDNLVIGTLWLQLIEKIPNPTSESEFYGYITSFFMSEHVRGLGIGTKMLDLALSFCREQDVHSVILWPTEKSRTLYERHGFAAPPDLFELVLI